MFGFILFLSFLSLVYYSRNLLVLRNFCMFLIFKISLFINYLKSRNTNIKIYENYATIDIYYEGKTHIIYVPYDVNMIPDYDNYELITDERKIIDTFAGIPYFVNSENLGCKYLILKNKFMETSENYYGNNIPTY